MDIQEEKLNSLNDAFDEVMKRSNNGKYFRFCIGYRIALRNYLRKRDGDACPDCGLQMIFNRPSLNETPNGFASFDHLKPVSLSGDLTSASNLRLMRAKCNRKRGNGLPKQAADPNSKKSQKREAKKLMREAQKLSENGNTDVCE